MLYFINDLVCVGVCVHIWLFSYRYETHWLYKMSQQETVKPFIFNIFLEKLIVRGTEQCAQHGTIRPMHKFHIQFQLGQTKIGDTLIKLCMHIFILFSLSLDFFTLSVCVCALVSLSFICWQDDRYVNKSTGALFYIRCKRVNIRVLLYFRFIGQQIYYTIYMQVSRRPTFKFYRSRHVRYIIGKKKRKHFCYQAHKKEPTVHRIYDQPNIVNFSNNCVYSTDKL